MQANVRKRLISIHASEKEATSKGTFICASIIKNFNPRLREGGDGGGDHRKNNNRDFNPRLREGGDVFRYGNIIRNDYFNPRLREGGDAFGE